jgi:hypothetical protein
MGDVNDKMHGANKILVSNLVDVKLAIHKHDEVLDAKIDDFKNRLSTIDTATAGLEESQVSMSQFVSEHGSSQ